MGVRLRAVERLLWEAMFEGGELSRARYDELVIIIHERDMNEGLPSKLERGGIETEPVPGTNLYRVVPDKELRQRDPIRWFEMKMKYWIGQFTWYLEAPVRAGQRLLRWLRKK